MFEEFKEKRKVKKAEKKVQKLESLAETMVESNSKMTKLNKRGEKAVNTQEQESWFGEYLENNQLNIAVAQARQILFVQRDRLIERMIRYNKNYKFITQKEDYPNKKRDLAKYMRGSKNAAYAISVVCNAITRLDEIPDEKEWCDIMRSLTRGYKVVNAISTGSDLMTRMAFWVQKAKMEMKGDINVAAMEQYYGKPIDQLLESEDLNDVAANFLVEDSSVDYSTPESILGAITGGSVFKVDPETVSDAADYQSRQAQKRGSESIFNDDNVYADPKKVDVLDDLPTNL